MITTQMGPAELPDLDPRIFLGLDEMSEDNALALIERYQTAGSFSDPAEREAARGITRLLSGFPFGSGDRCGFSRAVAKDFMRTIPLDRAITVNVQFKYRSNATINVTPAI